MQKTSEQVLAESQAWLLEDRHGAFLTVMMVVLGSLILVASLLGIAQFLAVNACRFGTVWSWTRIPWQPLLAWAIWFSSAYIASRSASARWQNFSLATMVAGTAGMIVFAFRAAVL